MPVFSGFPTFCIGLKTWLLFVCPSKCRFSRFFVAFHQPEVATFARGSRPLAKVPPEGQRCDGPAVLDGICLAEGKIWVPPGSGRSVRHALCTEFGAMDSRFHLVKKGFNNYYFPPFGSKGNLSLLELLLFFAGDLSKWILGSYRLIQLAARSFFVIRPFRTRGTQGIWFLYTAPSRCLVPTLYNICPTVFTWNLTFGGPLKRNMVQTRTPRTLTFCGAILAI